jgi:heptaprenyl diphosphate synthase
MIYHGKSRTLVLMSLFAAQALVLNIIESMIPVPFIAPGAKLGLANIVTVSAMYILTPVQVLAVIAVRVMLSSIFSGSMLSLVYSMSGALLSFAVMILLKNIFGDRVGLIGVSCAGAVFHNIGQLLAASLIMSNIRIISYLPVLSLTGIVTGIFVGITSFFLIKSVRKIFYKNSYSQCS